MANTWTYRGQSVSDEKNELYFGGFKAKEAWYKGTKIWDRSARSARRVTLWEWCAYNRLTAAKYTDDGIDNDFRIASAADYEAYRSANAEHYKAADITLTVGDYVVDYDSEVSGAQDLRDSFLTTVENSEDGSFRSISSAKEDIPATGGIASICGLLRTRRGYRMIPGTYYMDTNNLGWITRSYGALWATDTNIFRFDEDGMPYTSGSTSYITYVTSPRISVGMDDINARFAFGPVIGAVSMGGIKSGTAQSASGRLTFNRVQRYYGDAILRAGSFPGRFRLEEKEKLGALSGKIVRNIIEEPGGVALQLVKYDTDFGEMEDTMLVPWGGGPTRFIAPEDGFPREIKYWRYDAKYMQYHVGTIEGYATHRIRFENDYVYVVSGTYPYPDYYAYYVK